MDKENPMLYAERMKVPLTHVEYRTLKINKICNMSLIKPKKKKIFAVYRGYDDQRL